LGLDIEEEEDVRGKRDGVGAEGKMVEGGRKRK
jgi:hypothetical protein